MYLLIRTLETNYRAGEEGLSGYRCLRFLQRTRIWYPASRLTTDCNSSSQNPTSCSGLHAILIYNPLTHTHIKLKDHTHKYIIRQLRTF